MRGNDVAEDVGRLLPHAQIADDEPVVVDTSPDEIPGKPAQAVHRPHIACTFHRIHCRGVRGKMQRALVDHERVEAFEMAVVGHNNHAPQQRIQWCGCQEYWRVL